MTLMVLAIRLYDVGLRDDAVFWFYAAKNRYFTLAGVADVRTPQLAQVEDAVRNFAVLAGPVINGYAFCDVANQQKQQAKALQWVTDHPVPGAVHAAGAGAAGRPEGEPREGAGRAASPTSRRKASTSRIPRTSRS